MFDESQFEFAFIIDERINAKIAYIAYIYCNTLLNVNYSQEIFCNLIKAFHAKRSENSQPDYKAVQQRASS